MGVLTKLFIKCGWSRDDLKWGIAQIVSLCGLVTTGVFDVSRWAAYLGIPLSDTGKHWIMALCGLVLLIAGKFNSSPLYSKGAMESGLVAGSPQADAATKFQAIRG